MAPNENFDQMAREWFKAYPWNSTVEEETHRLASKFREIAEAKHAALVGRLKNLVEGFRAVGWQGVADELESILKEAQ